MRNRNANHFSMFSSMLMYAQRDVVTAALQKWFLKESSPSDFQNEIVYQTLCILANNRLWYWRIIESMQHICLNCNSTYHPMAIVTKTGIPWFGLHVDYRSPLKGAGYFAVVNRFWKWPEVHECKKPTSVVTVSFLHELFPRYGIPNTPVFNNRTEFMPDEFRKLFKNAYRQTCHHFSYSS